MVGRLPLAVVLREGSMIRTKDAVRMFEFPSH